MDVKLLGYYKGVGKKSGKPFAVGYFSHEQDNVKGVVTLDGFLGPDVDVDSLQLGREYKAYFGRDGKSIEALIPKK